MATKATEREDTEGDTEALPKSDGPLLDLTDAAVKRMIKLAKKRGYVTYDELNQVLPSEEFTSEQIEDVLGQLSEMGINVVEAEEAEEGRTSGAAAGDGDPRDRDEGADRPHRRSGAHVPARDGLGRAALARGRDRDREAHRGRPRGDDRRPVREPADLPGDHHLARRARRGPRAPARHHRPRGDLCRPRRQGRAESRSGAERQRRRPADAAGAAGRRRSGAGRAVPLRHRAGGRGGGAAAPARGPRGRRPREQRLALGDGGRAEAEGAGDLRLDRRQLQEAAPAAGRAR